LLNTNGSLGDNFTRKIEKIPTHQKFLIRLILCLFIVLMMLTWLDETRRQKFDKFLVWEFFQFFVYNDCCLIIQSIKKIYPKGRPHYAAVARQFLDTRLRDT
jgi:hypothetical protein